MLLRPLLSRASPAGPKARLSILIFHRVLPGVDPLFPDEVDALRFDAICAHVRRWFNVLPLLEASRRLQAGTLPARSMCITFDDGYADNRTQAAPILIRHGLSATFFVATGFLDGGRMWNDTLIEVVRGSRLPALPLRDLHASLPDLPLDRIEDRRAAIASLIRHAKYLPTDERLAFANEVARRAEVMPPDDLMMSSAQVRELRALNQDIGAHTVSHPILRTLPRRDARREIEAGKSALEQLLGESVTLFAYPNGKPGEDYALEHVGLARDAGFEAAVSTQWGVSTSATDPFQLRRFTPWDRSLPRFGLRLLRNAVRGMRD